VRQILSRRRSSRVHEHYVCMFWLVFIPTHRPNCLDLLLSRVRVLSCILSYWIESVCVLWRGNCHAHGQRKSVGCQQSKRGSVRSGQFGINNERGQDKESVSSRMCASRFEFISLSRKKRKREQRTKKVRQSEQMRVRQREKRERENEMKRSDFKKV